MIEWVKYSPYGIPFGLPGADTDSDGDCDATDISNFDSVPSYDVRYDVDLDGDNDATDKAIAQTYYQGTTYGWDTLSSNPDTGTGNRKGYAGYEYDSNIDMYHIRNRVLHPELGRWTRRDPLGYVDGMSIYEYVGSSPLDGLDPNGTTWSNVKIHCRSIKAKGVSLAGYKHCFIECCDSKGCNTYSLLNQNNRACINKNDPADNPNKTHKTREYRVTGSDCSCFEAAYQNNKGCNYRYCALSCNSNWFASSLFACCAGFKPQSLYPDKPGKTPGWNQICCRYESQGGKICTNDPVGGSTGPYCGKNCPFKCPKGSAGSSLQYCCNCIT